MSLSRRFATLSLGLALLAGSIAAVDKDGFTDTFAVKAEDFTSTGRNRYFVLEPGYQLVFQGERDKDAKLVITVLDETKMIDGVETRVVEERETNGEKLAELSRNYFVIDKSKNDVYYFGEDVDEYQDGKLAGHPGNWQSGKDGAHYGLFMPDKPRVGQKFYQEVAPKVAMDRCEVLSITEKVAVPAGAFENCAKMVETTPLEPGKANKLYAPGVGLLVDGDMKLTKHGPRAE